MPLIPAHSWQGWYATFDRFDDCYEFGWEVSEATNVEKRLVSVHEAPIPSLFEPVRRLFTPQHAAALLVLDAGSVDAVRAIAARFGGALQQWPAKPLILPVMSPEEWGVRPPHSCQVQAVPPALELYLP